MVADGGLPANFDVLLDVARGVKVIRGWRRWLLLARDALVYLGWSDQPMHPRELRLAERRPDTDSLVFLMIGRDAADGQMRLTPLFRRFDTVYGAHAREEAAFLRTLGERLDARQREDLETLLAGI